jgi:hypothetical protein
MPMRFVSLTLRISEVEDLMIGRNLLKHVSFIVLLSAGQPLFNDIPCQLNRSMQHYLIS